MCVDTEILSAYLDGELPSGEYQSVQQHLANCLSCQVSYRNLETLSLGWQQLAPFPVSDNFLARVLQAVDGLPVSHQPVEALSAYLDGELPQAEAEHVEAHLETCPSCQNVLDSFANVSFSLLHLPAGQAEAGFASRVLQAVEAATQSHPALETLSAYTDSELAAADAEPLVLHLAACHACQSIMDSLASVSFSLTNLPVYPVSDNFLAGVLHAVDTLADSHYQSETLSAYSDGELPAAESAAIAKHLATCGACQSIVDSFAQVAFSLAHLPTGQPEAGFASRVMARIPAGPRAINPKIIPIRNFFSQKSVRIAAGFALFGVLTTFTVKLVSEEQEPQSGEVTSQYVIQVDFSAEESLFQESLDGSALENLVEKDYNDVLLGGQS